MPQMDDVFKHLLIKHNLSGLPKNRRDLEEIHDASHAVYEWDHPLDAFDSAPVQGRVIKDARGNRLPEQPA